MRRSRIAMPLALILVALAAAPASGVPIQPLKPVLVTTACLTGDQLRIRSDWSNQDPDPSVLIEAFTWTFKGPGLPTSPATLEFIANPIPADSYVQADLLKFLGDAGLVDWNRWTSIGTSASGSFTDRARSIRQPKGGWAACPA